MYEQILKAILESPGLLERFLNGRGTLNGYSAVCVEHKPGSYDDAGAIYAVYSFANKQGVCHIKFMGEYSSYEGSIFTHVKQVVPTVQTKTVYE